MSEVEDFPENYGRCIDCGRKVWGDLGINPNKMPADHELTAYEVLTQVWKETGLEFSGGFLCITHLEERIGRNLTPTDFAPTYAQNFCTSGILTYLFPEEKNSPQIDSELREVQREFISVSWRKETGNEPPSIPEEEFGIVSQRLANLEMHNRLLWWREQC